MVKYLKNNCSVSAGESPFSITLAALYIIICGSSLIYYLQHFIFNEGFSVFFLKPALCLGFFAASLLYFFCPKPALNGLLVLSLIAAAACFLIQNSAGLVFHTIAFMVFSHNKKLFTRLKIMNRKTVNRR
ncbi:hypothetical protein [Sedimentisphaera salicampi]|uniref:hypothetical protein n=1 Tax=Sedimentisphaera salicampi TaxID=1941349 RepID=UPI000A26C90F|nr:hypothetical protein [Sedimentisphaera salicampi]